MPMHSIHGSMPHLNGTMPPKKPKKPKKPSRGRMKKRGKQ